MVKVATTKAQRKLFFNLRSMKQGFKADASAADAATHRDTLSDHEIDVVAAQLNVKREEVIEMETRMSGGDVLLDPTPSDDSEQALARLPTCRTHRTSPPPSLSRTSVTCWLLMASPTPWQDWTSAAAALWKSVGSR